MVGPRPEWPPRCRGPCLKLPFWTFKSYAYAKLPILTTGIFQIINSCSALQIQQMALNKKWQSHWLFWAVNLYSFDFNWFLLLFTVASTSSKLKFKKCLSSQLNLAVFIFNLVLLLSCFLILIYSKKSCKLFTRMYSHKVR